MERSRNLAALIGPALIAMTTSEALRLRIFAGCPPSVVYLNGAILFVAGLAIIRSHNRWSTGWPVVVTLTGWLAAVLGLSRMYVPEASAPADAALPAIVILFGAGAFLTFKAFRPRSAAD